jgi:hypothetical protein
MTKPQLGNVIRLAAGLSIAAGVSTGLTVQAAQTCYEPCDGNCFIGTYCETCATGAPDDCWISWNSGDDECYRNFMCQWSCPSCYVS